MATATATTTWACTQIVKHATKDDFEHGEDPKTSVCTMSENVNITAPDLGALIAEINKRYGIEIDDVYLDDDQTELFYFVWQRHETAAADQPSDAQIALWRDGKLYLYSTRWEFRIECREVRGFSRYDLLGARINFHN